MIESASSMGRRNDNSNDGNFFKDAMETKIFDFDFGKSLSNFKGKQNFIFL